jgi:hypothetical protein
VETSIRYVGLSTKGAGDRNPLPAHWLSTQMGVHEQPEQMLCPFDALFDVALMSLFDVPLMSVLMEPTGKM